VIFHEWAHYVAPDLTYRHFNCLFVLLFFLFIFARWVVHNQMLYDAKSC